MVKNRGWLLLLAMVGVGLAVWFGRSWYENFSKKQAALSPYIVYVKETVDYDDFGTPLAFQSDLRIMDLLTKKYLLLTEGGYKKRPSVSSDGKVYYTFGKDNHEDIWVIDLVLKVNQRFLSADGDKYCANPICSHSGRNILYEGNPKEARDIIRVDSSGDNAKILTRGTSLCGSPSWSPDDRRIVFDCRPPESVFSLWLMDSSGANQAPLLAFDGCNLQRPAWHPKKNWIVFQSNKTGTFSIYAVELGADGNVKRVVPVAVDVYENRNPRWSPDGKYVIYQSDRPKQLADGSIVKDFDVYMVKFDPDVQQTPSLVTNSSFDEVDPCWVPVLKGGFADNILSYLSDGLVQIDTVNMKNGI